MRISTFVTLFLLMPFLLPAQADADVIVASEDFDSGTESSYGYAFGGYGGIGDLGNIDVNNDGLGPDGVRDTADDGPDFAGNNTQFTKSDTFSGPTGNAGCVTGDFTQFVAEAGATYTYLGMGFGITMNNVDFTGSTVNSLADLTLDFDSLFDGIPSSGTTRVDIRFRDSSFMNIAALQMPNTTSTDSWSSFSGDLSSATVVSGDVATLLADLGAVDNIQIQFQTQSNLNDWGANADNSLYVDNISLTAPSAIPEPGAIALLCLVGVVTSSRRRRV
jgi:hypothetical protein